MRIQLIAPEQTLELRHKILRPHQPKENSKYPADTEPMSFHVGAWDKEELVGVASFALENKFNTGLEYRLRGMATSEKVRGLGYGKAMIRFATEELKKRKVTLLWCNAREVAFGFYLSLGFEYRSELFEIEGIGPHKVMSIKI